MAGAARIQPDFCYPPGLISVEAARAFLLERARPLSDIETLETGSTLGRVLAQAQSAAVDVPPYDNSAMDGYAVRAAEIAAAERTRLRVAQRIAAGGHGVALGAGEAARIFTGAPLPEGADAVVMQEHCQADGDAVWIPGPVAPGRHVRPRGNDIAAGTEVLAAGTRMRPQEMGLAASVGLARLPVTRRLRVAMFSSGNELVAPGGPLAPGCIYNSNRYTLRGLLAALSCETLDLGVVEDTLEATRGALQRAADAADLIVTSGGVSVGEEDHLKEALAGVGRLELWQVAVKPGKPLAYGRVGDADFLGLPGNPVSTLVTFCLFVRPFILRRAGMIDVLPRPTLAAAAFEWPRPRDRREYVRARVEPSADGAGVATLYPKQGSDVLSSAAWAQGLVEIPEGATVQPGDPVMYYSFADMLY
ncbi:MAG: molybdopterin molybdenumtransferase MoeA [Gammaproteobacteria bacterium]|nr:molybdopterin molybdenumtransferase MoeA [Gammaproteobacteria bacterium]